MAGKKKTAKKTTASAELDRTVSPLEEQIIVESELALKQYYAPKMVRGSVVTTNSVGSLLEVAWADLKNRDDRTLKNRKTVNNVTRITIADDILGKSAPMGEFQRAVLEAVFSEIMAGNMVWTSSMLYRTMTGKKSKESVGQEQQRMVDEAMSQLMYTPLHIDLNDYATDGQAIEGDPILDGVVLPAERLTLSVSGNTAASYRILALPIILRFCMATQSLTMTPIELLSVDNLSYTQRTLSILNAMQRQIGPLLYPFDGAYRQPRPLLITYESLYDVALEGSDAEATFTVKQRIRDAIHTILDSWVAHGYLSKWEPVKERRSYVAFRVYFPRRQPPRPIGPTPKELLSQPQQANED